MRHLKLFRLGNLGNDTCLISPYERICCNWCWNGFKPLRPYGFVFVDDRPVLVVYKVPGETDLDNADGCRYHAVFCSDIGPLHRYEIHMLIAGWEKLMV
jgi:hypothetical protein